MSLAGALFREAVVLQRCIVNLAWRAGGCRRPRRVIGASSLRGCPQAGVLEASTREHLLPRAAGRARPGLIEYDDLKVTARGRRRRDVPPARLENGRVALTSRRDRFELLVRHRGVRHGALGSQSGCRAWGFCRRPVRGRQGAGSRRTGPGRFATPWIRSRSTGSAAGQSEILLLWVGAALLPRRVAQRWRTTEANRQGWTNA